MSDKDDDGLRVVSTAGIAASAIFAFSMQSTIADADPHRLFLASAAGGLGVMLFIISLNEAGWSSYVRGVASVLGGISLFIFGTIAVDASNERKRIQAICGRLQARMLDNRPFSADTVAVYRALACKAQG